jgi:hypothetical protein
MFRRNFLPLPVHARGALVIDLHAIHADVALPRLRIARDHAGQRDEPSAIFRPALQDRKIEQRKIVALDHFFTGPVATVFGKNLPISASIGSIFTLSRKPCGDFTSMNPRCARQFRRAIDFERQPHPPRRSKLVDEKLRSGIALQVLEQQSLAADVPCRSLTLRNPVGNLGNFQNRVRFRADALQFAGSVERFDPVPQIVVGQNSSLQ